MPGENVPRPCLPERYIHVGTRTASRHPSHPCRGFPAVGPERTESQDGKTKRAGAGGSNGQRQHTRVSIQEVPFRPVNLNVSPTTPSAATDTTAHRPHRALGGNRQSRPPPTLHGVPPPPTSTTRCHKNTPCTTRRGCGRPRGATGTGPAGTAPGGALRCRGPITATTGRAGQVRSGQGSKEQVHASKQRGGGKGAGGMHRQPQAPTRGTRGSCHTGAATTTGRVGAGGDTHARAGEAAARRTMKVANDQNELRRRE